jgi:hypothetical protein
MSAKRKTCDGLDVVSVDQLKVGKTRIQTDATQLRTLTLPDASGTVALTTDVPTITNMVTTDTAQTISGVKTFSSNPKIGLSTLATNATVARTVTFPDATGTVALTTDIVSVDAANMATTTTQQSFAQSKHFALGLGTESVSVVPTSITQHFSTWTSTNQLGSGVAWTAVAYSLSLNRFVAVGRSGTQRLAYSADGITWTTQTTFNGIPWQDVIWVPELSLFVVSGNHTSTPILTSPDGITWTAITAPSGSWTSLAWSKNRSVLVAVGDSIIMTSSNGLTWVLGTSPNLRSWTAVCRSEELDLFVAVCNNTAAQKVMVSADGITWTNYEAADQLLTQTSAWAAVIWAPGINQFFAVATGASNVGIDPTLMTSTNGTTWLSVSSSITTLYKTYYACLWLPEISTFVAAASNVSGITSWTPKDGWVSVTTTGLAASITNGLGWNGTRLVITSGNTATRASYSTRFISTLTTAALTATRTLTLPDATGTLALTTDVPANMVTTDTTQTLTGDKTTSNHLTVTGAGSTGLLVGSGGTYGTGNRMGNISSGIITIPFQLTALESRTISQTGLNIPGGGTRIFVGMITCPTGSTGAWDRVIVSLAPGGYPVGSSGTLTFQLANTLNSATTGDAALLWYSTTQS